MKSFVKYPGGKAKEFEIILSYAPKEIKRYFEPFVGGGSVFFGLGIKNSYINDKSKDLMDLYSMVMSKDIIFFDMLSEVNCTWKNLTSDNWLDVDFSRLGNHKKLFHLYVLQKQDNEMKKIIKLENMDEPSGFDTSMISITAIKAAYYYVMRYVYNTSANGDIKRIISYYFMREFCYSSMFRFSSNGDFNVPYGGQSYNIKSFDNKISLMQEYDFAKVKMYNQDFGAFLKRFRFTSDDFIFVDPPYDSEFSDYDGMSFDKKEQDRLASQLSHINAKIMIVIKNTDFIYNLYKDKGFKIDSFDKKYSVNFQNRNNRDAKHLMITNY